MFGLAYLIFFAVYLTVSILVIRWAVRFARKREKSGILWGFVAAFIMYNLVFWDWIPTVVAHKYYCSTEAGFWVYKTVDQWEVENPKVMGSLVANENAPIKSNRFNGGHGKTTDYTLNDRFKWIVTQQDFSILLPIVRTEQQVKDVKGNEILARYVDFGSGSSVAVRGMPLKFWLQRSQCREGTRNQDKLRSFRGYFEGHKK